LSTVPAADQSGRSTPKRPYGAGSLLVRRDARGREAWYGQWWIAERRVNWERRLDRLGEYLNESPEERD